MLVIFFLIPFGIMVATSFYHRIEGAFYQPAFEFDNWQRLFQPVFLERAVFSIGICLLAGFGVHRDRVPLHLLPHADATTSAGRDS